MSNKREFANIETNKDVRVPGVSNEPSVPVPMRIVRWAFYSLLFACALIPFAASYWQDICGGLILGHFAGQLNALINKKA